jgi:hypothetical protein
VTGSAGVLGDPGPFHFRVSTQMRGRASVRAGITAGLGLARLGRSLALPPKMKQRPKRWLEIAKSLT